MIIIEQIEKEVKGKIPEVKTLVLAVVNIKLMQKIITIFGMNTSNMFILKAKN